MSKYVCIVQGKKCSLAFITKDNCTVRIDRNEIVELTQEDTKVADIFFSQIKTFTLKFKGKLFLCFETDFKKYFISLAEMRNQKIDEILDL